MNKRQFVTWFLFMIVLIITVLTRSLWKNKQVYWEEIVIEIIAGLIGGMIGIAIIKIFKRVLKKRGL